MSDHELIAAVLGATGPTLFALVVQAWHKRQEDQRKETGKRIGRLEKYVDFERGRQAGLREAARRESRGR